MYKISLTLLSISFCLAVNTVSADHLPIEQEQPAVENDVGSPVVNFFGVIYTISSTVIRQTRKLKYQGRDKFDQLIYDIKAYDIENRIDK